MGKKMYTTIESSKKRIKNGYWFIWICSSSNGRKYKRQKKDKEILIILYLFLKFFKCSTTWIKFIPCDPFTRIVSPISIILSISFIISSLLS